jgi:outer membrane protein insertion porin family
MRYRLLIVAILACACLSLPAIFPQFLNASAQAATVGRIIVEGNQRVETETVLSYMQIGPGDYYDEEKIDESVKALFQTGLFSDVRVFLRGGNVVVQVEENPMINKVDFAGNDEIDDEDLAKEVELRERMVYTRSKAQSDIDRIVAVYRRAGYYNVKVEPRIIKQPQNRVNLVFEIV